MKILNKISKILLLVISVIILLFIIGKIDKVKAASSSPVYTSYKSFQLSHPNYNSVKDLRLKEDLFLKYDLHDEDMSYINDRWDLLCMEYSNALPNKYSTGGDRIRFIIDINKDGNQPDTMIVSAIDYNGQNSITSSAIKHEGVARMAYIAKLVQGQSDANAYKYKNLIAYEWHQWMHAAVQSAIGSSWVLPNIDYSVSGFGYVQMWPEYVAGSAYEDSLTNGSPSKYYRARILMCADGGQQDRGIVYGEEIDPKDVPPAAKIDKYITKLKKGTDEKVISPTREKKTDTEKKNNPVKVEETGTTVRYAIKIPNTGGGTVDTSKLYWIGDSWTVGLVNYGYLTPGSVTGSIPTVTGNNYILAQQGASVYTSYIKNNLNVPSDASGIVLAMGKNDCSPVSGYGSATTNPKTGVIGFIDDKLLDKDIPIFVLKLSYNSNGSNKAEVDSFNSHVSSYCNSKDNVYFIDPTGAIQNGNQIKSEYQDGDIHVNKDGSKAWYDAIIAGIKGVSAGTSSNGNIKGTFSDVFDNEYLEFKKLSILKVPNTTQYEDITNKVEEKDNGNGTTTVKLKDLTIAKNETATFILSLKVKDSVPGGTKELCKNTAKFKPDGGTTMTSSDWIKLEIDGPEFKIEKYISKVESLDPDAKPEDSLVLGKQREGMGDSEKGDSAKLASPVCSGIENVKITYKVIITNIGEIPFKGKLTDKPSWASSGGKVQNIDELKKGEKKTVTVVVELNGQFGKTYENKAKFTITDPSGANPKSKTSSDWIKLEPPSPPELDKSITDIGGQSYSREGLDEDYKQSNPVEAGSIEEVKSKTVTYKVVIKNNYNFEMKGTFSDFADNGINLGDFYHGSEQISNGAEITISAGGSYEIEITGTISATIKAGIYRNTAEFTLSENSNFKITSSDYLKITKTEEEEPEGKLKKYISNIENSPGTFKSGRREMSDDEKYANPGEVVKGSIVEFTLEAESNIHFTNVSEVDHDGNYCSQHYEKETYDLICTDTPDPGLEFVSCSGASYNNGEVRWTGIKPSEDDQPNISIAKIKFRVTASNMTLPNLGNNAADLKYEYTEYSCKFKHGTNEKKGSVQLGEYWVCKHDACYFEHDGTTHTGDLDGEENDYVRLLDPEIAGTVFLDEKNGDNLMNGDYLISNMEREEDRKVLVELWNKETNQKVDEKYVDANGNFNFGRVRKGTTRVVASGSPPEWTDIGVGNYFYYDNATLYHYYIIFDYNGERYRAVENAGDSNLDPSTHAMNSVYPIDSNAEEDQNERTEFNNRLETNANNKAFEGPDGSSPSYQVDYDVVVGPDGQPTTKLQESKSLWDGNKKSMMDAENSVLNMKAKTFDLFFGDGETDYLLHINLGLRERDKANLSLTKDVVSAEVTVNGFKTVYTYEKLGDGIFVDADNDHALDNLYTLRIYREDYEYRTSNQPSVNGVSIADILNNNNPYTDFDRSNDLEILIKYKITVTNTSETTVAVVREIADYCSSELIPCEAKIEGEDLEQSTSSKFGNNPTLCTGGKVAFYSGDALTSRQLDPNGGQVVIESLYKVEKTSPTDGYIKNDLLSDTMFQAKFNVAEVGAYSFYEPLSQTPAGLIDTNSNPGNIETDGDGYDTSKFEDDTFATGIIVVVRDDIIPPPPDIPGPPPTPRREKYVYRNISGIVFEDMVNGATPDSDSEKVGDGVMSGSDTPAKNVIVKLYEVVRDSSQEYLIDTGLWYRTGDDGRYYFGDGLDVDDSNESTDDMYKLHAGNYVTRFIYGDEADKFNITDETVRYSGQDFKSAKYTEVGTPNQENEIVEADSFAILSGNTDNHAGGNINLGVGPNVVSVARDNEIRRLEVNNYSTTMTYAIDTVLKATHNQDGSVSPEEEALAANTAMFADTKAFSMDIEYIGNYDSATKADRIMDGTLTVESTEIYDENIKTIIEYFNYSVRDINFGIIERPKTKLQLMNDITEIKAITEDGSTLLDIFFDVVYDRQNDGTVNHTTVLNKEKSVGSNNVQILNRIEPTTQGFRYANIDSELLQGLTITIKFKIAVANISDVDHITSDLESKIEAQPEIDLNVDFGSAGGASGNTIEDNGNNIEVYASQTRTYNRQRSALNDLLYGADGMSRKLMNQGSGVAGAYTPTSPATYQKVGTDNVLKQYTYMNISKLKSDYGFGSYVGNIYYNNVKGANDVKVQTRVDQYIDYVDTDLVFKAEENVNSENRVQYLTYTASEIAKRGLLRGVKNGSDATVHISDGERDYFNSENTQGNNNLAFNLEDGIINKDFYKFLPVVSNGSISEDNLYVIGLQASKFLTSELDLEGVEIENLAEIIKVANTVGRKVYVRADNSQTTSIPHIGNTTLEPQSTEKTHTTIRPSKSTPFIDIAKEELDTDFTEYITFSPPTGLSETQRAQNKTANALLIIIPSLIIVVGVSYVTVQFVKRKKFYK